MRLNESPSEGSERRANAPRRGVVKKVTAVAASATVIAGANAFAATPASAYNVYGPNCRYDPVNDNDGLGVGYNKLSNFYDPGEKAATDVAMYYWNSAMTPQLWEEQWGTSKVDVLVDWDFLGANVGGQTTLTCGNGHYSKDPWFEWGVDATYYSPTLANRSAIAVHELGHAYGVAHNNNFSCDGKSAGLMYTDAVGISEFCGRSRPTSDDVNGAIDAHNG